MMLLSFWTVPGSQLNSEFYPSCLLQNVMRDQPLIGTKEIAGYAQQLQDGFGGTAL